MSDRRHREAGELLTQFVETLRSLDSQQPQTWRLCEAARQVCGADGVVATVGYLSDIRTTLCATDDIALAVESLQELVGEGPGFDAARSDEMVSCYLGEVHRSRWSHLAQALWDELTDVTVYAIPIPTTLTGVVTLYTNHQRPLDVPSHSATVLARALGAALLTEGREQQESPEGLHGPWESRAVVHQATGMVMSQLDVPADDALSLLRSHAYADDAGLVAVARQVVERSLTFSNAAEGD